MSTLTYPSKYLVGAFLLLCFLLGPLSLSAQKLESGWGDKNLKVYHLDDYNRFPTLYDYFSEFVKELRYSEGQISVLVKKTYSSPSFGKQALIMINGVPVSDHETVMSFPPGKLSDIMIYQNDYLLDGHLFNGIVNFITSHAPEKELGTAPK